MTSGRKAFQVPRLGDVHFRRSGVLAVLKLTHDPFPLPSFMNGTFTVAERTLPMRILPAAEQGRLKSLAGQDVRTAKERQRTKMLDYELRRIDLRLEAGEITETEAAELRADANASATFGLRGKGAR